MSAKQKRLSATALNVLRTIADGDPLLWGRRTQCWFTLVGGDINHQTVEALQVRRLIRCVETRAYVVEYGLTPTGRALIEGNSI